MQNIGGASSNNRTVRREIAMQTLNIVVYVLGSIGILRMAYLATFSRSWGPSYVLYEGGFWFCFWLSDLLVHLAYA